MRHFKQGAGRFLLVGLLSVSLVACGLSPVPLEDKPQETPEPTTQTTTEPETQPETEPAPDAARKETDENAVVGLTDESLGYVSDMDASEVMAYSATGPIDYNTEEYDAVEETGFVTSAVTPLSTVSADVDTASYANLRRMLLAGYRTKIAADKDTKKDDKKDEVDIAEVEEPYVDDWYYESERIVPVGAVRIEEMLNYFDYDYALPEGEDAFGMTARVGACPWNEDTQLLVLGFATAKEDPGVAEKGSNLVFLIDVSGSMRDADKLPLLQSSFAKLVETLGENDRVSIVTYSGEEEVVLDGVKGSEQREIMKAVRGLEADGMTNGEAGLRMAYDVAKKNFIEGGVNRIVMASDGDLNVGMTSESDLYDFVEEKRDTGVYLSVLGFGEGNYKDNKMETLADHGNGSYHYIDCEEEASRVFGDRLTANLVPFANDVKVQVEFNPSKIKGYRLIGYENRAMAAEDFQNDEKDAGEVGPNSQFTVAYEIVPADSKMEIAVPDLKYGSEATDEAKSNEWLTAKLRYQPIDGGDVRQQELVVDESNKSDDPGDDWRFAAAVTEFGMILRDSEYKGTSSYDDIRNLVGKTDDGLRTGFLDLVDHAEKN